MQKQGNEVTQSSGLQKNTVIVSVNTVLYCIGTVQYCTVTITVTVLGTDITARIGLTVQYIIKYSIVRTGTVWLYLVLNGTIQ